LLALPPVMKSRLAPTPSGYLHIGNAFNFVLTWVLVRMNKGKLMLRIDDMDRPRVKREYLDDIFHTLEWLGIDWDEGPFSVSSHEKHFSQKNKNALYESYVAQLQHKHLTFVCDCSRKKIESKSEGTQYSGTCRNKQLTYAPEQNALRIITGENASTVLFNDWASGVVTVNLYETMRDFVIKRRDGLPAYQIVSVVEDIVHEINFIVRGQDLLHSTAAQIFLSQHLEKNHFADTVFFHHRLLKDEQNMKLSKSAGSNSIKMMREQSGNPSIIFQYISNMLQLASPVNSAHELLQYAKDNSAQFKNHIVRHCSM
jgi:glutamyl/glutaminyl-tRNA synthetase